MIRTQIYEAFYSITEVSTKYLETFGTKSTTTKLRNEMELAKNLNLRSSSMIGVPGFSEYCMKLVPQEETSSTALTVGVLNSESNIRSSIRAPPRSHISSQKCSIRGRSFYQVRRFGQESIH